MSVSRILRDGEAQFKWHIESRHSRRSRVQLHARKIMDRIGTALDKVEYSFKPASARGDFRRRAWYQAECAQTGDIRQIEILKPAVVRDVQKYGIPLSPSWLFFGHILRWVDAR